MSFHQRSNFPEKLMYILNQDAHPNIISWLPHGRGFVITDKKRLETEVLPKYFKVSKFTSFTRRLNRWEFTIHTMGHKKSSYFHPKFVRHDPRQCLEMFPAPQHKKKSASAMNKKKQKSAVASKVNDIDDSKKKSASSVTKEDLSLPPFVHDDIKYKSLSEPAKLHQDNEKIVQALPNQIIHHQQLLYNLSNAGNSVLPGRFINLESMQSPSHFAIGNPSSNLMAINQAHAYLPNSGSMNPYSLPQQTFLPLSQGIPYVLGNVTQQQQYPLTTIVIPNSNGSQEGHHNFSQQFAPMTYDSSSTMLKQHPGYADRERNI